MIIDQFAGPGGWEEGLRLLGRTEDILGFEIDDDACATRAAAGHLTAQDDVSKVDPEEAFAGVFEGLIASPPCPAFSSAGKQEGMKDMERLLLHARRCRTGWVPFEPPAVNPMAHAESALVLEPLRWAHHLRPRWIACEQVKEVLPFWRAAAETLQRWGYRTWAGILNAADYGVPQTRRRAILMASLDVQPHAPNPTHHDPRKTMPMFGEPWVSMAQALGWNGHVVGSGYGDRKTVRSTDEPAPSVAFGHDIGGWAVRTGNNLQQEVEAERPAPTLAGSVRSWARERPATTVCGDARFGRPGHKDREGGEAQFEKDSIKITVQEAAILQGFRPDYPWQGSRTSQFKQIGNAIPPPLAAAILRVLGCSAGEVPASSRSSAEVGKM